MYETPHEKIEVEAVVKDETLWLSQKSMAKLFWVNPQAITKHLGHIFEEWELIKEGVCSILEHTANDGKNYKVQYCKQLEVTEDASDEDPCKVTAEQADEYCYILVY